ncbi:MAG: tetratricopeptide repeat protein, partial [Bacteroidia bacterium]|nr:tetratricopeptide repeat protein [Bacteroidia bacterium]
MNTRIVLILISLALPGFFYCDNNDSLTIAKLLTEAREYFGKNPQEGKRIAFTALEKAKALNQKYLIAKSYNTIGSCLYYMGNTDSVIIYHEMALEIQKSINDLEGLGRSYTNIGILLMDNGNNKKAVEYFLQAEKVFLKINYELGLGKIYNNIGVLFYNMRDFENGIINYQKSLKLATKQKDSLLTYSILTNIASCYSALRKHNMALEK